MTININHYFHSFFSQPMVGLLHQQPDIVLGGTYRIRAVHQASSPGMLRDPRDAAT